MTDRVSISRVPPETFGWGGRVPPETYGGHSRKREARENRKEEKKRRKLEEGGNYTGRGKI